MVSVEIKGEIAAIGNGRCIFHGSGEFLEIVDHLLLGFKVELIGAELKTITVIDGFTGLHAQQDIMGADIVFIQIMTVIGGHQGNGKFCAHLAQSAVDRILQFQTVILDFQEKVFFPEKLLKIAGRIPRLFHTVGNDQLRNFAMKAG